MGSCQCRQRVASSTPTKYDLQRIADGVGPVSGRPAIRTSLSVCEDFDSIPRQSVTSSVTDTARTRKISPRTQDDVIIEKIVSPDVTSPIPEMTSQEAEDVAECASLSDKSGVTDIADRDSDFGSECLSTGGNSAHSDNFAKLVKHPNGVSAMTSVEDDVFMNTSFNSSHPDPELEGLESSQDSTFFGHTDRTYLRSRLGRGYTRSTDSLEVLQWKRGNRLGQGSYGTVWLGLTVTGELIAVKQIELMESDPAEIQKEYAKIYEEVSLLRELTHRNIVKYLGSSYEKSTNHVISVFMQFVPGGSLASILQKFGPLEEPITSRYSRQILDAVAYLHTNNIIHRDIKSANILLMPEGIIKLIDFGCAKKLAMNLGRSGSHLQVSLRGTPYWMAPEVINETGHGKKSDIWSVGCTVFELLTGKPPWADREPLAAIYAIGSDEFPVPLLPDSFSEAAREFVQLCMLRDKYKRPGASKLLTHNFLRRRQTNVTSGSSLQEKDSET